MTTIYDLANSLKDSPELARARRYAEESSRLPKRQRKRPEPGLKRKRRVLDQEETYSERLVKFRMIEFAIKPEIEASGFSLRMIRNYARSENLCEARDRIIWRAKKETDYSVELLGMFFNRDHASILNSCKNHEERLQSGEQIEELK